MLLAVLLSVAPLAAQVVTGAIAGRITDTSGAVIPGATMQVQNVETGLSRSVQSDAGGRYVVRNLPVGSYTVTVQQSGFQTVVRSGITLTVGSEVTVNVELNVGAVAERVEVTGEAPAIETTSATLSNLVSQTQLRDLPLNGRSYDELALLAPGVVEQTNTGRGAFGGMGRRLSISGARPLHILFLLDGTVASDYNVSSIGGESGQALGVESVREFRLLTHSFSAEYGRNSGGVFSMITRAGTNEFHGSVYEFLRNNALDARDFFNRGDLPAFRRNQFGAALGGPVVRDRIFFFANYEGFRRRQGAPRVSSVPDANARQGLLPDASGVLRPVGPGPNNGINPVMLPYLNLFPLPNGQNLGGGIARYSVDAKETANEDYGLARVDFSLSESSSLYYRFAISPSERVSPGSWEPWFGGGTNRYQFHILSGTHIFSPTFLTEMRFAFNRTFPRSTTGPLDIQNGALDFLPGQGFGAIVFRTGAIATGGQDVALTGFGNGITAPRDLLHNLFQVSDTFSYVRGAHAWKFGFDVQRLQANYRWTPFPNQRGNYAFANFNQFLLGRPAQVNFPALGPFTDPVRGDGFSDPIRGWRQTLFGWFVEDAVQVRPSMTLTLGLRQEFVTSPSDANGRHGSLPSVTAVQGFVGPPFPTSKDNLSPRVGLAWDPFGRGRTSIRAGFGMFYSLPLMGRIWDTSTFDYRFARSFVINDPPFPNPLAGTFTGLPSTRGVQQDVKTTTSVHWNVELQQQITPTLSLQVGYVASKLTHLEQGPEANRAVGSYLGGATLLPDGRKFFAAGLPLINPNFSQIQWVSTPGWGIYHGLQVGVLKRISHGLTGQFSYTWSRNLSSVDQQFGGEVTNQLVGPLDLDDLARDYSLSNFHQGHVMNINGKYQMPWDRYLTTGVARTILGGWEINTNWRATTGLPQVVGAGFNVSRNRHVLSADRPDLNPGFSNSPNEGVTAGCPGIAAGQKLGTPDRYFDPCAFALPLAGTYGNLGRNTLIGPGLFIVNVGLVKNTSLRAIRESMNLEFRAEAFNLFNRANFQLPAAAQFLSTGARNPNVGRITATATENRQLQFGLKLTF
ncbi:MAG: hypothetical protein A3H28_00055 [Acidobacteria bacterium RIFCSPLOWO2_02_FULL_61_28]|nr:MAG: hypothetical protein A3H28_00055 [Acidobacteria bacterium RIFCSPLOWO2_02_FULL_61_28]